MLELTLAYRLPSPGSLRSPPSPEGGFFIAPLPLGEGWGEGLADQSGNSAAIISPPARHPIT